MFRVASVTKIATAMAILRLCDAGAFTLDTEITSLLPGGQNDASLRGITLRMLLSHTSGLRDTPSYEHQLAVGGTWHEVLRAPGSTGPKEFHYCNFGFGLLGCVLEQATGLPVSAVLEREVFAPLGMTATLDASTLDESQIMPIRRVLSRRPSSPVTVTPLGRIQLAAADPLRHFGHTAGAMHCTVRSLRRLADVLCGLVPGYLPAPLLKEMTSRQSSYGRLDWKMDYGLGLILVRHNGQLLLGHQGYAYGCVDGLFCDPSNQIRLVSLNGGASEARIGRLGCINRELIRWCFG